MCFFLINRPVSDHSLHVPHGGRTVASLLPCPEGATAAPGPRERAQKTYLRIGKTEGGRRRKQPIPVERRAFDRGGSLVTPSPLSFRYRILIPPNIMPSVRPMSRSVSIILATMFLSLLAAGPVQAQLAGGQNALYVRFGQGASDLSGNGGTGTGFSDFTDPEKFSDDDLQYAFSLEVGYHFSSSSSLGIGYQLGSYYHRAGAERVAGSSRRHTLQLLARNRPGAPGWIVTPYFDIGINVSSGARRIGVGPSIGAGLNVAVDNQMAIFLESRLNFVFPNQTAETAAVSGPTWIYSRLRSGNVPFDILSSLPTLGVKFDLR